MLSLFLVLSRLWFGNFCVSVDQNTLLLRAIPGLNDIGKALLGTEMEFLGTDFLLLYFIHFVVSFFLLEFYGFNGMWDMWNTGTVAEQVMLLENIGTSVLVTENQVL